VPEGAAEPFSGVLPPWAGIWFMAEAHRE